MINNKQQCPGVSLNEIKESLLKTRRAPFMECGSVYIYVYKFGSKVVEDICRTFVNYCNNIRFVGENVTALSLACLYMLYH